MSQYAFSGNTIINQSFPDTRTALNAAYAALASNSSGDNDPTSVAGGSLATVQHQWWYDSANNKLMLRNDANNAWIEIATIDETSGNVLSITTQGLTIGATALTATGTEINQLSTITRGSILYGNASGATARLAKGGAGTVLTSDGTDISWAAAGGGGGGTEFITSSGAISNAATVDFTQFDSTKYDSYQFRLIDILPVNDNVELRARTSSDTSNPVYDTGAADYIRNGNSAVTASFGKLTSNLGMGNGTQERSNFVIDVLNPHTTNYTRVATTGGVLMLDAGYPTGVGNALDVFARAEAAQVNAIRFFVESGNISSGEIVMYGFKKA